MDFRLNFHPFFLIIYCYISEITTAELLYGAECSSNKVLNEQLVYEFCNALNILEISNCLKVFAKEKAVKKLGYNR